MEKTLRHTPCGQANLSEAEERAAGKAGTRSGLGSGAAKEGLGRPEPGAATSVRRYSVASPKAPRPRMRMGM